MATTEEQITGIKWDIIEQLSKKTLSPKELADNLNTTIANVSQQLKLLEAYGYVKKKKNDQGKGSRKQEDRRTLYSLAKTTATITNIQPSNTRRAEVKTNPLNQLMINLLLLDLKENAEPILGFFMAHKDLVEKIDAAYLLEQKQDETHILIITEKTDIFRVEKSRLEVNVGNKKYVVVFWSHTLAEFVDGLKRGESYFWNQWKRSRFLIETKIGVSKKIEEEQRTK